jgi:hypothetical protein
MPDKFTGVRGDLTPLRTVSFHAAFCLLVAAGLAVLSLAGPIGQVVRADVPPYAWHVERVETPGDTGLYTSIAVDSNGDPYIAYVDNSNGRLLVAHRVAGTWSTEVVAVGSFSGNTNVLVSSNGTVDLSFFDAVHQRVMFASRRIGPFSLTPIDRGYADGFNRLALDTLGRPVIAYTWDNGWLRYGSWDGSSWRLETVDNKTAISRYIGLAMGPGDHPHISYTGNGVLRHAARENGTWTFEVVDHTSYSGWFSRIAIDSLGSLHIAYYDSVNGTLRYAVRVGGTWFLSPVDGAGDAGWDLSMTVDSLDRVQIAYYARVASELRYAIRTPSGWTKETVDEGGVVGWYTGIAVNGSGFPRISYYDWTNGDLKYAESAVALEVRTLHPIRVTSTSASLRGEVVSLGAHSSADIRFALRAAGSSNWTYVSLSPTNAAGTFTADIGNLSTGLQYEYRVEARAGNETALGDVIPFLVPTPVPEPSPWPLLAMASAAALGIGAVSWLLIRRRRSQP